MKEAIAKRTAVKNESNDNRQALANQVKAEKEKRGAKKAKNHGNEPQ